MFETTPIPDLLIYRPRRFDDERGFFSESWSASAFAAQGLSFDWCQDNHSLTRRPGMLRGLHYQAPPMAQTKLVRCTSGRIWDVAADMRADSPGLGRWFGIELSPDNGTQLLIPRGFLHGFVALEANSEVQYKVDNPFDEDCDGAVAWNDPVLAIDWPLDGAPVLSAKDAAAPTLADWRNPFTDGEGA